MKKYQKAQMIAKNLPTGSYAAGCPKAVSSGETYNGRVFYNCAYCQTVQ